MTLFLFVEQGKIMEKMTVEEQQLFFNKIDLEEAVKIKEVENDFSRRIDDALIEQGYQSKEMWAQCTIALTLILLIMTCLVCYYKPDFVNLTVCVIAIHILVQSTRDNLSRKPFNDLTACRQRL